MNTTARDRIAAAIGNLRPDWPVKSLRTLLENDRLANRPWADVAIALTWVACDTTSKTPARVLEAGPWWHATVHGVSEADASPAAVKLAELCWICSRPRGQHPLPGCAQFIEPPDLDPYDASGIGDELRDRLAKAQRRAKPAETSHIPDPRATAARRALTAKETA